jgi:mannan endo-1,4-beta-mannosidase
MIPIISLWEATGKWDKIQYCVDYWCSAEILPILQKYQEHLLLNIANEPGDKAMADTVFRNTYSSAVSQLRAAGLHMPLIIDADNWGRHADAVLNNGPYLLDQDPDKNLIFSWHLWDPSNWGTGTKSEINRIINKAAATNICFIVGEFGPCEQCDKCTTTKINWEYMIEKAYLNDIGYLPWVWKWTDCHSIVNNETGAYGSWVNPSWGEEVAVNNAYSIQKTAKKPSELQTGLKELPGQLPLSSVSPNPFTEEVIFNFQLREPSFIRIVISDLYGRKIKTLTGRLYEPGELMLPWSALEDGNSIQRGIYIYSLNVENESGCTVETGKMIKL